MKDIKIRYTFKYKDDGRLHQEIYSIYSIEMDCPYLLKMVFESPLVAEVIARDLWIGIQDEHGTDIYQNDLVSYMWNSGLGKGHRQVGIVNQQGAEWFVGEDRFVNDGDEQVIEVWNHKVIGNIHLNPQS